MINFKWVDSFRCSCCPILVVMCLMEVKMPTICYMNILEKAGLTSSIRYTGRSTILLLSKLAITNFCNPLSSLYWPSVIKTKRFRQTNLFRNTLLWTVQHILIQCFEATQGPFFAHAQDHQQYTWKEKKPVFERHYVFCDTF